MKKILCMGLMLGGISVHAQQPLLTDTEAVEKALKNNPALKAASLNVRQNEQLIRSARNIPNPDLTFDSPSGTFYTLGVQQSFRFPTVYQHQSRLQNQQVELAQKEQLISQNDLKFRVRSVYQLVQAAEAYRLQITAQDSLYEQIRQAAQRQFEAGTIDKLALIFAQTQAAEVHNTLFEAAHKVSMYKTQLSMLMEGKSNATASTQDFNVLPFSAIALSAASGDITQNPLVQAAEQVEKIGQQVIAVERANALPGFMVGYYNQASRETNFALRWRIGLSIPLWAGQYKSRIAAAQTGVEVAKQRTEAQKLNLATDLQAAFDELEHFSTTLTYFQTTALRQADELITTSRRFFENGQTDYVSYLRTTNDAYNIKLRYLETLRSYHQTILNINYLTGKL
jgi:outer membrane protein, heavy metal efflux system